jgi:hypothetical protein
MVPDRVVFGVLLEKLRGEGQDFICEFLLLNLRALYQYLWFVKLWMELTDLGSDEIEKGAIFSDVLLLQLTITFPSQSGNAV